MSTTTTNDYKFTHPTTYSQLRDEFAIRVPEEGFEVVWLNQTTAEPDRVVPPTDRQMVFDTNNSMVAWVDATGYYFCPLFPGIYALFGLGFRYSSLYVPFSSGNIPADSKVADRLEAMWAAARSWV